MPKLHNISYLTNYQRIESLKPSAVSFSKSATTLSATAKLQFFLFCNCVQYKEGCSKLSVVMDYDDDSLSPCSPPSTAQITELHEYDGPPLSPRSEKYRIKRIYLLDKYRYIHQQNNRLRNRLYHVKKEINNLKRLKRILCQRLVLCGDRFMDSYLEIPDNEPVPSTLDKPVIDIASKTSLSKKRKLIDQKRTQQPCDFSTMEEKAKNSVASIIDSVVTESHEERMRACSSSLEPPTPTPIEPSCSEATAATVIDGSEVKAEVDSKWMTERMLRASSIDHLLPSEPDPDPDDVLTGFGENLEENFMAVD
ncbi:hypothetical protein AB6A40_009177 [Gnathostoma spinigerum]|uniref:Uncharacterized protein n=1 Tax=Gnathostoma spinigerum TaxID=75299 RepID=A0ABD6EZC9_9BILA